jgi:gliding motility-associated-like protein
MASFGAFSRTILAAALSMAMLSAIAQRDLVGSGRALSFDGVDDHIDLGNIYDDVTLPITISAWIKLAPDAVYNWAPILVSQDNAELYNGFWFTVRPDYLGVGYGDGQGEFVPAFRRGKEATITGIVGRWAHVAAVVRGPTDMSLYVDGVDVGGAHSGNSNLPMSSNWPGDVARIGKWTSNAQTLYFKGEMDEVRFWRRALTEGEIRATMCKKTSGADMAGLWSYNELSGLTVEDDSPNNFNGAMTGGPVRGFSGAAIGDVSTFNYSSLSLLNDEQKLWIGDDSIFVSNASDLRGIQIYGIDDLPSQVGGVNFDCTAKPYFGVFVAPITNYQPSYDIRGSAEVTGFYEREDNSISYWTRVFTSAGSGRIAYEGIHERVEVLPTGTLEEPDLGADTTICTSTTISIESSLDHSGVQYLWNTGANSKTIFASVPGIYWLEVSNGCGVERDSIVLTVRNPPTIDLGPSLICLEGLSEYKGDFASTVEEGTIVWGTVPQQFGQPGKYWVTFTTQCGSAADTVLVVRSPLVEFPQAKICSDRPLILSPVIGVEGVAIEWNDGSSDDTHTVAISGQYTVKVHNQCGTDSATVNVQIDAEGTVFPNVITPNGDGLNDTFKVTSAVDDVRLVIFDPWGLEVYRDNAYKNDWAGGDLSTGVYYFKVTTGCQERAAKGHVSILR